MHDIGNNRFWISVTCPRNVRDEEWVAILMLIDELLKTYDDGVFSKVHVHLEEGDDESL